MVSLGIVEGFYGPAWSDASRLSYAEFFAKHAGDFYIYAPKQDAQLRKAWREPWDAAYVAKLRRYTDHFHQHGVKFGVGFSPFGLGTALSPEDAHLLEEKAALLQGLAIDILGLFFDDMRSNDHLAETQIAALQQVQRHFHQNIIFCPSYYSSDSRLETFFGKMPERYLETIATGIGADVQIAWTGPLVISPEISRGHLVEVSQILRRKPFIWDNFYANDGPKNCKFLKLKPYHGRSRDACQETAGFALNMMNQAELSKILFLSSHAAMGGTDPDQSLEQALNTLCSAEFTEFFMAHKTAFNERGLDLMDDAEKERCQQVLGPLPDLAAREIQDWLAGSYVVGTECLTD